MPTQEVVARPARAAMFLTLTVPSGSERAVRTVLAGASDLTKSVAFRSPDSDLLTVIGLGAEFWDRIIDKPRPRDLHVLPEIRGAKHTAVSTPGDVLVHVRATHIDICFEFAWLLSQQLGENAVVVDEVRGFRYYDDRDLLGFADGTANPIGDDARSAALVQPERDPEYAGSSYVIVQKYLHDMTAWHALSVEAQERVIGRYKLNDVEIPDAHKAMNSHVALNTITDENGVEHDILRDNLPFGEIGAKEFGTYFIGYAGNPNVTEQMLRNMFIGRPEGNYDRILDFSTAHTGNLFFVPTADFLDGLDDEPLPAAIANQTAPDGVPPVPQHAPDSEVLGPPPRWGEQDQTTPNRIIEHGLAGADRPASGTSDADRSGADAPVQTPQSVAAAGGESVSPASEASEGAARSTSPQVQDSGAGNSRAGDSAPEDSGPEDTDLGIGSLRP